MFKKRLLVLPAVLLLVTTLACSMQSMFTDPTPIVITATPLPATETPIPPTEAVAPTSTNTVPPTETSTSTNTPTATATATNTPIPCNRAEFVSDITVPDGEDYYVSDSFTKTWRLMNTGSCEWDATYRIVFVSGDQMGAPASKKFTNNIISNGSTVDVSLLLTAPSSPGTYKGYFKLQDGAGNVFGIGPDGNTSFWVEIDAIKKTIIITPILKITLLVPVFPINP
jgi:hypothetical protein